MKAVLAALGVWLAVAGSAPAWAITTPFDDRSSPSTATGDSTMFSIGIGAAPSMIFGPESVSFRAGAIVKLIDFDCDRTGGPFDGAGDPDCRGDRNGTYPADLDFMGHAARYGLDMEFFDGASLGLDVGVLLGSGGRMLELFGLATDYPEKPGSVVAPPRAAFVPAPEALALFGAGLAALGLLWRRSRRSASSP